jgi:hypothetical protein
MKYYMIIEAKTDEDGFDVIIFHRRIYFCRDEAFDEADKIEEAVVFELQFVESWNRQQRRAIEEGR